MNICDKYEHDVNKIINGLYLGNNESSYDNKFLFEYKITHIIRVMKESIENNKNITYIHIPIEDEKICSIYNSDINGLLDFTSNLIHKLLLNKNNNILVHCKKGHHRSAVIVAAFLMKYLKMSLNDSIACINNMRICALTRDSCMVKGLKNYDLYLNKSKKYKLTKII